MKSKLQQKPNKNENYEKFEVKFNPDRCNLAPEQFNNNTRLNLKNLK